MTCSFIVNTLQYMLSSLFLQFQYSKEWLKNRLFKIYLLHFGPRKSQHALYYFKSIFVNFSSEYCIMVFILQPHPVHIYRYFGFLIYIYVVNAHTVNSDTTIPLVIMTIYSQSDIQYLQNFCFDLSFYVAIYPILNNLLLFTMFSYYMLL